MNAARSSPVHVRRSQGYIQARNVAKARTLRDDSPPKQVLSMSDHIDEEKARIQELEREIAWIDSEMVALLKQMRTVDEQHAKYRAANAKAEMAIERIDQVSRAITLICHNWIMDPGDIEATMNRAFHSISHIDTKFASIAIPKDTLVCTSVADAPRRTDSVSDYLGTYEKGLCELLGYPLGTVPIVHAAKDSEASETIRMTFTLPCVDRDRLPRRVEAASLKRRIPPAVQFVLDVTNSFIIDASPIIDQNVTSGPYDRVRSPRGPQHITSPRGNKGRPIAPVVEDSPPKTKAQPSQAATVHQSVLSTPTEKVSTPEERQTVVVSNTASSKVSPPISAPVNVQATPSESASIPFEPEEKEKPRWGTKVRKFSDNSQ